MRRSLLLSGVGLVALACSARGTRSGETASRVAAADTSLPTWTLLGDSPNPSRRKNASMAFNSKDPLLVWGGVDESDAFDNDTWLWGRSTGWARQVDVSPGGTKPHPEQKFRSSAVFAGVPLDSHMVNVEGQGVYLLKDFDNERNELELWRWSDTAWSLLSTLGEGSNGPWLPGLPIAPARDGIYAYEGGFNTTGVDLWKWTPDSGWRQVTVNVPLNVPRPARRFAPGLALDEASGSIVLVGGYTNVSGMEAMTDTWTWSLGSNQWTRHTTAHEPPWDLKLAFNAVTHKVVGFSATDVATRYEWDGQDWTPVDVKSPYPPLKLLTGPSFAYDGARDVEFLFGGDASDSTTFGCCDTSTLWRIDANGNDAVAIPGDTRTLRTPLRAYDPSRQRLVVLDDVPRATREYDGGRWTLHAPIAYDTSTAAIAYDSVHKATAVYTADGSFRPVMCLWNGTSWSCTGDPSFTSAYSPNATMAFDQARGQMVLFATDFAGKRVTRLWDGTTWSTPTLATQPAARSSGEAMVYDAARKRVVLPPGSFTANGTTIADASTWEWDGASWTEIHAPGFSSTGGVAFSEERRRVVSLTQPAQGDGKLLEWRGTEWAEAATVTALPSVTSIVGVWFPGSTPLSEDPFAFVGEVATTRTPVGGHPYDATSFWGLAGATNGFSLSLGPASASVLAGKKITFDVHTTLTKGAPETIQLAVEDLPSGVTGTFAPASVSPGDSATLTLAADASAPVTKVADTFTVVATSPSVVHVATARLDVARCVPLTACPAGLECGVASDGCGGVLDCGTCTAADTCHTATCTANVCVRAALKDGASCSDGSACTADDVCASGACGGITVHCLNGDPCHDPGTCQGTSGVCSPPVQKKDGTGCFDGNACTSGDACIAGTCAGAPVVCANGDACNDPGACQAGTGICSPPVPKKSGSVCDDGNACTKTDICASGKCTGADPVACTAGDSCHAVGTCDPASGVCSNPAAGDGTHCNADDKCIQNGACQNGACTGTPIVCAPQDECHFAGACAPSTGVCSSPVKPDGAPCSQGTCVSGTCTPAVVDAGTDSGKDAGADAGSDSGADAGADSGTDAGTDSGADAGADSGNDGADAGSDSDAEVGPDAASDADAEVGHDAGRDAEADAGNDTGPAHDSGAIDDAGHRDSGATPSEAGTPHDAASPDDAAAEADAGGTETLDDAGCSCRTGPSRGAPSFASLLGAGALAIFGAVRRRRRRAS